MLLRTPFLKIVLFTALLFTGFSSPSFAQTATTQTMMDADGNLQFDVASGSSGNSFKMNKDGTFRMPSGDAAPCDAAHAGSMRWNSTTVHFEGCNGTAWTSLASRLSAKLATVPWTLPAGTYPNAGVTKTVSCASGQMSYCILVKDNGSITCSGGVSISADGTSCTGVGLCNAMTAGGLWYITYACATLQ